MQTARTRPAADAPNHHAIEPVATPRAPTPSDATTAAAGTPNGIAHHETTADGAGARRATLEPEKGPTCGDGGDQPSQRRKQRASRESGNPALMPSCLGKPSKPWRGGPAGSPTSGTSKNAITAVPRRHARHHRVTAADRAANDGHPAHNAAAAAARPTTRARPSTAIPSTRSSSTTTLAAADAPAHAGEAAPGTEGAAAPPAGDRDHGQAAT